MVLTEGWLTIVVTVAAQGVTAIVVVTTIKAQVSTLREEVKLLREWRHSIGQKATLWEYHGKRLDDLENRVLIIERKL